MWVLMMTDLSINISIPVVGKKWIQRDAQNFNIGVESRENKV